MHIRRQMIRMALFTAIVATACAAIVGQLQAPSLQGLWRGDYGKVTRLVAQPVCVADCRNTQPSTYAAPAYPLVVGRAADGAVPPAGLMIMLVVSLGLATLLLRPAAVWMRLKSALQAEYCVWLS